MSLRTIDETKFESINRNQKDGLLDLKIINAWLVQNHKKVAEFYNDLMYIETSDLQISAKNESEKLRELHLKIKDTIIEIE